MWNEIWVHLFFYIMLIIQKYLTMKPLIFAFVLFLIPFGLKAQVVHGQDWVLINYLGTVEIANTSETDMGQLFSIAGYRYEEMPPILGETFAKNVPPTRETPEKISVEFFFQSFSNVDSMEIYLSIGDSVVLQRWTYFWQRYLVDLSKQNIWVKFEWELHPEFLVETKTFNRIGFLFELYSPEGERTSCQVLLRNIMGITSDSSYVIDLPRVTDVNEPAQIPIEFKLEQNYPNPFNPTTTIRYELPKYSSVNLTVYDMLGRRVAELVNQSQPAGIYEVPFDGSNLASGTYIYVLRTENFILKKKMILLK